MEKENFDIGEELEKSDLISQVMAIAGLDALSREQERNRISEEYNIRKSVIDQFIRDFEKQEKTSGTSEIVTEDEPLNEKVCGDELLSTIRGELLKHVILPPETAVPIAAWIVLTYCFDAFRILPILAIISPTMRCGKSTLLEILQAIVNKGLTASNISPAATFRIVEKYSPTLLIDEMDTYIKDNDELRGILNSGHTKATAFVIRVQGDDHEPAKFSTWGPKAVAMIGTLPDTLQDRSVVVSLRRKAPGETVKRINADFENSCIRIRRACKRWADDNIHTLKTLRPEMPTTNNDRVTDNWLPLFAIAEVAGGEWPELIRKSLLGMMNGHDDSIGPKLLKDIQGIFECRTEKRIFSDDLVEELKNIAESPWVDWNRGKGLTQNGLARLLKPFSIKSKTMRIDTDRRKGYDFNTFVDSFKRYIPSPTPPISSVTPRQVNKNNELEQNQSVTSTNDVTVEKRDNPLNLNDCHDVTVQKGVRGEKERKQSTKGVTKCQACRAHDKGKCYAYSAFDCGPGTPTECEIAIKSCTR